jgi:Na+-transporting NADH:ubiquinone oxidoreductase subunit A
MIKIKKGLKLPITGAPKQIIDDTHIALKQVALLGDDYIDMKPSMNVILNQSVKRGDLLWVDKKNPGIRYTAPASGKITAIHRGAQRKLLSVVIDIKGNDFLRFQTHSENDLTQLSKELITQQLNEAGLWTALRTRPYSKIPQLTDSPVAIFVSIMDTNPLAPNPQLIIAEKETYFNHGLTLLKQLSENEVFVTYAQEDTLKIKKHPNVNYHAFSGKHPAGNVGTHIHFLKPVNTERLVWHIHYQDVIAIGELFLLGELKTERIIAIGGPLVNNPRLIRTLLGANLDELLTSELKSPQNQQCHEKRVISGSVFNGHIAIQHKHFLGRYHSQVSVLNEGREKELFGWLQLGVNKYSVTKAFISHLMPNKLFDLTTSTHGSERAIMPIGSYERVMPWDILATPLIRALVVGDTDTAQKLGCLEFDEEDLALCTFVCPGKYEYGPILRDVLTTIEKEG